MGKKLTDILPKISQWENIPYVGDFSCPHCDKSGFYNFYGETRETPNVVGWCETPIGYMGVFECPICFEKYRFHCTIGQTTDIDKFDSYLYYKAKECKNWEEINSKLKDSAQKLQ